jgi:nucleotidyltransferase AbiEii toxin of type IV toxin-antitoxin system
MLDNKLLQLIDETGVALELPSAVIEKDYYVTQVIHVLSDTENEYFRLVFAGGTCLAKAHKIVKRMSEDVDFKIQLKNIRKSFSKSLLLKELKQFRSLILSKLITSGLSIGEPIVRNEGQYSRIEINYPSALPTQTRLRPHILVEFTLSDIRLSTAALSINTLIEDTLKIAAIITPSTTQCISVDETAIEKWVGLTRRIIAIARAYHPDDETLIRHVYDLNAIHLAGKINSNFFTLANDIIKNDSKQFKNQHHEYWSDPSSEIKQSLSLLKNNPIWKERYQIFIETMVYDKVSAQEYENALNNLEHISMEVIDALHQFA